MPDRRRHRGPHPGDPRLFTGEALTPLRAALADYAWLLSRGYAEKSALKLVGDRHALTTRRRLAVLRSACSDQAAAARAARCVPTAEIAGQPVAIDGYNLLILLESALSGAFLFAGRDRCLRDLAGLHGTYRRVEETLPAVRLVGRALADLGASEAEWWLDAPVSNSGRLREVLLAEAAEAGHPWRVQLAPNPDRPLAESPRIVVSSDSWILDRAARWTNLGRHIIEQRVPDARLVNLEGTGA